jgi:hypothetical protein
MLEFRNVSNITLENLDSQPEVRKKQIALSIAYYEGEEYALENLSEAFYPNHEEGIVFCELYEVTDKSGKVLYDFWQLNSDSGTVFFADTDQPAGIEMIQFYFDPTGIGVGKTPELNVLAENLQKGFDVYKRETRNNE